MESLVHQFADDRGPRGFGVAEDLGIDLVEPSGAVGVAALCSGRVDATGRRIGVILSGGNVDADRFAELMRVSE